MISSDKVHPYVDFELMESTLQLRRKNHRRPQDLFCGVCGSEAKGFHFGGPSCDSCKVFFRRSVQNDSFRHFKCRFGDMCTVPTMMQKKCFACRFAKCLDIGMNPRWVLSAEERQKFKSSRAKKELRKPSTLRRVYTTDSKQLCELLTADEMRIVRTVIDHFKEGVAKIQYSDMTLKIARDSARKIECLALSSVGAMHTSRIMRLVTGLPELKSLYSHNRLLLIRASLLQMNSLRQMYEYDLRRKCWPNGRSYDHYPVVHLNDYKWRLSQELLQTFERASAALQKLHVDEPSLLFLTIIAMLSTDNKTGLTQKPAIEELQERFLSILRKYVEWRYGTYNGGVVFPKLLELLTKSQEIHTMSTNEEHMWLHPWEIDYMDEQVGAEVNPLKGYSTELRNSVFVAASTHLHSVREDKTPSLEMIRRGVISIYPFSKILQSPPPLPSMPVEVLSLSDASDILTFLKELEEESTQKSPAFCYMTTDVNCQLVVHRNVAIPAWSPEEFDLSLCCV